MLLSLLFKLERLLGALLYDRRALRAYRPPWLRAIGSMKNDFVLRECSLSVCGSPHFLLNAENGSFFVSFLGRREFLLWTCILVQVRGF